MGPYITVVAPWKAKLLIWMPLQAYRFQGLEGGSETTRDVFEQEHIKKHQWFLYNCKWEESFFWKQTHIYTYIYIFEKDTKKHEHSKEFITHLGDASMST